EKQDLTSVVDNAPTKAPVLAKDLSIANRGQIIMHNNIYKVNLGMLSELESNLFFSLFNRLKDKKDTIIRFTPKELRSLAGNLHMDNERLYKLIINLFNNIAGANFDLIKMLDDEKVQRSKVMFFRKFEVQYDKNKKIEYLDIQVNDPYFTYLLNDLKANFTTMQLQTFVDLSGKYAKNLFRLLERFKHATDKNGVFHVHMYENNIEGFFAFMGIPKDFRITNIDARVLNPTIKQLTQKKPMSPYEPPYKSIKVIKNKAKARGQKVLGYTFEVIPNPIIAELEKALENAKTPPLKRFSKRDINTLNKCLDMRGKLCVRDKEGKSYTFNNAMITNIYPCPKTKRICVQFRINGFLDPEMMGVIDLYQDNRHLFQVCGNEYLSLVFESIDELKNKFLKTAYKSGGANATQTTTQADTPTAHTHTQNTPTSANQNTEIFVLQSPMPAKGGELVADCKNGRFYVFKKVQLIAKIQDAEQDVLSLFKILEPTDTDLEVAKRHHREKKDINFFKKEVPDCDAPHYFTYTFKKRNEIDAWRFRNLL
ncbi:replication initiation protein, partial [Helicobacter bizzozeronii]|uniref:replication initiation protein n=1 Tax=Helicobacter bizzozeronii TaxID=56877 RepID=UPI000CEDC124